MGCFQPISSVRRVLLLFALSVLKKAGSCGGRRKRMGRRKGETKRQSKKTRK